ERLHQSRELVVFRLFEHRTARLEVNVVHVLAAAEQMTQQRKRRRRNLAQHIQQHLPDDGSESELRIVQAAGHGQIQINDAIAVLEEGNGNFQRQVPRIRTLHPVTELQLIDHELVSGGQVAVIDLVVDIGRQLALLNLVAGESSRVRRDTR